MVKPTEYTWKIKVLEPEISEKKRKKEKSDGEIMIGVAPIDFDINSSMYTNWGWYYWLDKDSLYSGPPHNYKNKEIIIENKKVSFSDPEEGLKYKKKKKKKLSDSEKNEKEEESSDSEKYNKKYDKKKVKWYNW